MAALKKLTPVFSTGIKSDERITWTKREANQMKQKVRSIATARNRHPELPRILFIGETGSGKSSYISSIVSALSGNITYTGMIGTMEGREENTSKRYLEHRVFMDGEPLNFILCDARGIGKRHQGGVTDREIERLINGSLRHNDLIESERGSDGTLIDSRDPKAPSCVVFVQKAQRLGEIDNDVQDKLNKAANLVRERGIPSCVILTHIDVVKPSLTKNLHKTLSSRKIQDRVQRAAKEVGVNPNRVFVVKNYTCETRTHTRHDILILRALHAILVDVDRRQLEKGTFHTHVLSRPRSEPDHVFIQYADSSLRSTYASPYIFKDKPAFKARQQQSSNLSERSSQFFAHTIARDQTQELNQSDTEYDPDEPDSDEGIFSLSTEEEDPPCPVRVDVSLQNAVNKLHKSDFPESYNEDAKLRGAKPLYQPTVLQLDNTNTMSADTDKKLSLELRKMFTGEGPFHEKVYTTLQEWCKVATGSLWMSYTLSADLSLPLDSLPPDSTDLQVLFLAPEHPPFLLTVFDEDKVPQNTIIDRKDWERIVEEEVEQVRLYTLQIGKLLTTALLDYCCCDFLLLPCCVSLREFSLDSVNKEVQQQLDLSQQFYGGPDKLSELTYKELKEAAVAVTSVTHVPRLMLFPAGQQSRDESQEEDLVLHSMDHDWRAVVSLLVETMTSTDHFNLVYPCAAGLKTHVALLEAAKRLSFVDEVILFTLNQRVLECSRKLIDQVFEDTGVTLKLTVLTPGDQSEAKEPKRCNYVILLDCPPSFQWQNPDCMVLRVSENVQLEASDV